MDVDLIYIINNEAGSESFQVRGEQHRYIVKARRQKVGDIIHFRNLDDMKILYEYEITEIDVRSVSFTIVGSQIKEVKSKKELHVAWCVIDTNSIEKVLPSLSEIGVSRISFIYCDRSQRKIKLDFKRFERILEASMQQCGRSDFIKFDTYNHLKDFVVEYQDVKVLDLCENILDKSAELQRVLVGCEGGFSDEEREFLKTQEIFRLDTPMVLRSQSAVMAIASKILL